MAVTLKQTEAIPASYPDSPDGLSDKAAAVPADAIWERIESYIAHRFTPRSVVWTVEGGGDWQAPLTPASFETVEVWSDGVWADCMPDASPWGGYELPGDRPYRITADVGGGDVPAAVSEAFRRMAEYLAEPRRAAGSSSFSMRLDVIEISMQRNPAWLARAMQNSGAGDLLRPYRRP
ncbi:hypothetical protein [Henriciella litoralis]|uniref:hypothetical protein n=1 Tax=Henriciella litoralis TaxID=568102 RepID=UPI000A012861|nr:hypothetical protein [Henriciella litoralis]